MLFFFDVVLADPKQTNAEATLGRSIGFAYVFECWPDSSGRPTS